jgi:hypothetical protein
MCESRTEKNYNKIEETCKKKFTKCTTAYLLETNVASLSVKQASYIIIVVYPYGDMQKVWKFSRELCGLIFYMQSTNQTTV